MVSRNGGVDWRGDEVRKNLLEASRKAINEVMADCVRDAVPNTPYVTGNLRRSEKIQRLATIRRNEVSGDWGMSDEDANYAIHVEAGTGSRPGRYMLRNAADKVYPTLTGRIRQNMG